MTFADKTREHANSREFLREPISLVRARGIVDTVKGERATVRDAVRDKAIRRFADEISWRLEITEKGESADSQNELR